MKRGLVVTGLAALTIVLYAQTAFFEFVTWDDLEFVRDNVHVQNGLTPEGIWWALTQTSFMYWQPLVFLSHMTAVSLFGMNAGAHHLINALLHAANVGLWFWILLRVRFPLWTAAIAAALYGWHPLRVESVAWVTERKDVLCGLFWLLTIWVYLEYAESERRWRPYALMLLFFAFALMTKPVAVMLPVLLLLLDYWPLGRLDAVNWRARVLEKIPLLAMAALSAGLTVLGQRSSDSVAGQLELGYRITNAIRSYGVYLKQTVWPSGLSGLYMIQENYPKWQIAVSVLALGLLSLGAWRVRKTQPWWTVAWAWYLIALAPNIGIVQVGLQAHADRYTYFSTSLLIGGACFGVLKLLENRPRQLRLAGIAGTAVCGLLFVASTVQMRFWSDSFALYERMLAVDPQTVTAYHNLGVLYEQQKDYQKALEMFETAIRIRPQFHKLRISTAIAYLNSGNPAKALEHVEAALKINADTALAHLHHARTLAALDRFEEAKTAIQAGLRLNPIASVKAQIYMQQGLIEYKEKDDQEALKAFQNALEADPGYGPARKNAAIALGNLGRTREAIGEFETYLIANPDDASARAALRELRAGAR